MRFAFLIMGDSFDAARDRADIADGAACIVGVRDLEQACQTAKELLNDGIGCIELCGAFGETGAARVIEATENRVPVGFVTHLPRQDALYARVFGKK